jgi:hypothetical protein
MEDEEASPQSEGIIMEVDAIDKSTEVQSRPGRRGSHQLTCRKGK